MGGEWPYKTVEEVSTKVAMGPFGSSIKVSTFVDEGVPVISGQHLHGFRLDESPGFNFITEEHANKLKNANVFKGDVVFTHAGNIGQVAYITESARFERYVLSQRQFYMRCDTSQIIPEFVTYYFHSPEGRHKLLANTSQVGVPSISRPVSYLRTITIPVPQISEQRAIAHILGTLDDKIELNRQMNCTLEAMAQTLFKSFFLDFDPVVVNALRAGNPIPDKFAQRAAHYRDNPDALRLPEDTLRQFPDRFQDSELGPIPEGWRVGIVSDLATIASGKRPKKRSKEKNVEFRIPLYGGGGIMAYVEEPLVTEPLLLTGRVGTLGKIFRISEPCWPSDNTLILFPKKKIYFHFVFFMLQLIEFESLNRGSTQPLVTQMDLSNQSLVIPNANVSNLFWVNVYSLFEKIDKSLEESSILSSLRDTLLPKLVSGELRVPDAKKLLEDAL